MRPELFEIPFVHLTVKAHGLMIAVGVLVAVVLIRRLSRSFTPDPRLITNAALYALIGGVVGARIHYVVHYCEQFRGKWMNVFAIWHGGLELFGGAVLAITIIILFLCYHNYIHRQYKLPIRRYLDVVAIGLMLALVGRIGCFLNGCCWGKPTTLPWGVRFPYDSFSFNSQINADPRRNRYKPHLEVPRDEYLAFVGEDGKWRPKPYEDLTNEQQCEVTKGKYRCLPVHPTQLYASLNGVCLCILLYLFRRRAQRIRRMGRTDALLAKPGQTFALMFVLYGLTRFLIEYLRDDNPLEYGPWAMRVVYIIYSGGTISQNLVIYMVAAGILLLVIFQRLKAET
ncbi:MAG: prolipoprotein diacylglyceryl transferase [Phycisphaerae bacterium]|nr:prolipoprotein diacylglyceryl transferase [Phycisphaerae bacterium]